LPEISSGGVLLPDFKEHNFRKFLQMIIDKMANNYVAMPTNSTTTNYW